MHQAAVYHYLQPFTYLMFAAGFAMIWFNVRQIVAARYWMFAYVLGAFAFFLKDVNNPFTPSVSTYVTLASYFATVCLVSAGFFARAEKPIPLRIMSAAGAGYAVILLFFLHFTRA